MPLSSRQALQSDAELLGLLNHQLIRDEGHRNPMTVPELQERMRGWLAAEYAAVIFENKAEVVAYALYQEEPELIYLRQFFVQRHCRRQGFGRRAFHLLRAQIWPAHKRLTVEVLIANHAAMSFYKAAGFREYCQLLEIPPA
jgi:GNAT superfamily N-acetyltransferase